MRVLGINGSPHQDGNTAYALRYALALLEEAGVETETIALAGKTIHGCEGCFSCRSGRCKHDDDMPAILEALRRCDGLILASPVYMGLVTGQLKTMMDRTVILRVDGRFELSGKVGAGIACGGFRNGGQELTLQCMHTFFLQQDMCAIADGRIGYLGFSFHDTYDVFREIVDAYDWTFCQIQHNYMDVEYQAGTRGLRYAAAKGLAVVVMEPLLGGQLVNPPPQIQALWDSAAQKRSAADWALQWLWNQPEVSVVLSGMSTMQQVEENVASASVSGVGTLNAEELALVERVRARLKELCNLRSYNDGLIYDKVEQARRIYRWLSQDMHAGADACIQCRECEDKCPQSIPISEWMPVVRQVLGEGKPYEECPTPR